MYEEYDRAQLHHEVWSEPATVVAPRYGLSDVGLKKLCRRLEVPTPTRGHWAKVKAGRGIPPKPELKTFKGNRRYLFKRILSNHTRQVEPEVVDDRLKALIAFEQDPANRIAVPARGTRLHPLVAASRDAFHSTYKDGRGLPLSGGKGLNIAVSVEQRSRALRIANALVRALEKRGFLLVPGEHHLEVQMFGVRLPLNIFEATKRSEYEPTKAQIAEKTRGERVYWPRYSFTPTGCLEIRSGGGANGAVKDGLKQVVEEQLNHLIVALATQALGIVRFRDENARAELLRQAQRSEALAQKALQEVEQEKLESLRADTRRWHQAQEIRAYLLAMENSLAGCDGLNDDQHEFIRWARAKADWLDPLISAPDLLLDRKIHIPY